jgi:hypothetical protein
VTLWPPKQKAAPSRFPASESLDGLEGSRIDQWSHFDIWSEAWSKANLRSPLNHPLEEIIIRSAHDYGSARGRAALPRGAECSYQGGIHGLLEIGVLENYLRVFAAHLELHFEEPRGRRAGAPSRP